MKILTKYLEAPLAYDGTAIVSHWAFEQHGLQGDSAVAFTGPCEVKLSEMADLADVRAKAPIFSKQMLHLIIEHFGLDLHAAVWRQRLLVATLQDEVHRRSGKVCLDRRGNDLFEGGRKLNVSIAAPTPVSSKIHLGVNVVSDGTPVPTVGLKDLGIDAESLGRCLLERYAAECQDAWLDRCKVRSMG
jgi:hypothetical protein